MRLNAWWILAAGGIALATASVAWAAAAASERPYTVLWLGDSLLGDAAEPALRANGYRWAFAHLPNLDTADLTVMNIEGPISPRDEAHFPDQRWSYTSRGAAASAFARAGVDMASLANNHAFDRGPEGLRDTIEALRGAGITPTGAGTQDDLAQPDLRMTPHGILAIVAFAEEGATTPSASGMVPGTRTLRRDSIEQAYQQARAAGAEHVAAFVHWGDNYTEILPVQREWARRFDEVGYDLVVGTGPHIVQPIERIGDTLVAYSIGNFVFGTPGRFSEEYPDYGKGLTSVLRADGFRELRMMCVETDNEVVFYQPRPCDESVARRVLARLNPAVHFEGATGILRW
ncbi:MAG: CapA family protein [Chloroflexi bacterium]|nr:CapA family protein [Chloroflexota bacterium]